MLCFSGRKTKVQEICMCNKNVVFAKIQLDNLYMQVPVIDFLSNITSKIIMLDSNHSYDRKKKTPKHYFYGDWDSFCLCCVFFQNDGLCEEDKIFTPEECFLITCFFHSGFGTSFMEFYDPLKGLSSSNLHEPKVWNLHSPTSLPGQIMMR